MSAAAVDDLNVAPSSPGAIEDDTEIISHLCMKAWALPLLASILVIVCTVLLYGRHVQSQWINNSVGNNVKSSTGTTNMPSNPSRCIKGVSCTLIIAKRLVPDLMLRMPILLCPAIHGRIVITTTSLILATFTEMELPHHDNTMVGRGGASFIGCLMGVSKPIRQSDGQSFGHWQ
jgi:hypothetical protein